MKVGFIGSGNMASALVSGFVKSGKVLPQDITISDKSPKMLEKWADSSVNTTADNCFVCQVSDIIFFAVKPNILPDVLKETKACLNGKLLVSIAAGVTIDTIEGIAGNDINLVRVMPNTPALVACGMTVVSANKNVSAAQLDTVKELFSSVGSVALLDEGLINAATALHGSSPAYVYMLIDAMADSGLKHGIPKSLGLELAAKAVEGAAKMVLETKKHPSELKDAVCSPGGTTIAAVLELEKGGFCATVSDAIDACVKKADLMSGN